MIRRAATVASLRSPIGRLGDALRDPPLAVPCAAGIRPVMAKGGINPVMIEDVVFASSCANSETPRTRSWLALQTGLPVAVRGQQSERRCVAGLDSIATTALTVQSAACDVGLAGGIENMRCIGYYSTVMRRGTCAGSARCCDRLDRGRVRSQRGERFGFISGMAETEENPARDDAIARSDCDAFALASLQKSDAVWEEERVAVEVVAQDFLVTRGEVRRIKNDAGIRPLTTTERLLRLRPLTTRGGTTAATASQQNDALTACLIRADDRLADPGQTPLAFPTSRAAAGSVPSCMRMSPVAETARALKKVGLSLEQMDLQELNGAIPAQVLAETSARDIAGDDRGLDVHGSGYSPGHPIGATGVRIVTTLLHEMARHGARFGHKCIGVGGGQVLAAIVERA